VPVGDAPTPVNGAFPASLTLICKLEYPPAFNLIALVHVVLPEVMVQGLGEAVIKVLTGVGVGVGVGVAVPAIPFTNTDPITVPLEYKSKVKPVEFIHVASQLPVGLAPTPVNGALLASLTLI